MAVATPQVTQSQQNDLNTNIQSIFDFLELCEALFDDIVFRWSNLLCEEDVRGLLINAWLKLKDQFDYWRSPWIAQIPRNVLWTLAFRENS